MTRDQKGEVVMTPYLSYEEILAWDCTETTVSLTLSQGTRREVLDINCQLASEVERLLRDYTTILIACSEWARYLYSPFVSAWEDLPFSFFAGN